MLVPCNVLCGKGLFYCRMSQEAMDLYNFCEGFITWVRLSSVLLSALYLKRHKQRKKTVRL